MDTKSTAKKKWPKMKMIVVGCLVLGGLLLMLDGLSNSTKVHDSLAREFDLRYTSVALKGGGEFYLNYRGRYANGAAARPSWLVRSVEGSLFSEDSLRAKYHSRYDQVASDAIEYAARIQGMQDTVGILNDFDEDQQ